MLPRGSGGCTGWGGMEPVAGGVHGRCDGTRGGIRVVDVAADGQQHLARDFRLVGVPTFLFLDRQGEEVARLVGQQSELSLKQQLSLLRGERCPGIGALPDRVAPGAAPPAPAGASCGGTPAFFEAAAPACES